MLRFATSPTGDMDVKNLRVALFNYIVATQRKEEFVVRIEDTDKERIVEGKDTETLDILALFGIVYSNVLHQSENLRYHRMMAIQLLQDKKAFNCFCTPAELDAKRALAKEQNRVFNYDNTCAHLPPEMIIDNENPFTIRLLRPQEAIVLEDLIQGTLTFTPEDIDAFVIMDAKKHPTENFASGVDDMLSDISLVIRSEEQLNNTPKEIAVRNALGYDKEIEYAHLPLLSDDQSTSVKGLLEEGFLPSAIINYLIGVGNETPQEIFSLEEALEWFDLSMLSKSPATFEIETLKSINKEHLRKLDDKELSRYVGFADEAIGKAAKIYLEEVSTLKELRPKIEAIFAAKVIPEAFADESDVLRRVIMQAPYFETFDAFKAYIIKESAIEREKIDTLLSLLLTGADNSSKTADLYVHLKDFLGEIVK